MSRNSYWNEGGEKRRVDHVGWAREFIRAAENAFDDEVSTAPREEPTVGENIALAQVHATLALVEQQRITNLVYIARETHADLIAGLEGMGLDEHDFEVPLGLNNLRKARA